MKSDKEIEEEKELKKGWDDYRNLVIENKNKSQDDFEKYINILASGGIVLSITFLEKIVTVDKITWILLYILGLLLLVGTLLSNLYSHYKSMLDCDQIIKEIDDEKYDDIFKNIDKRNQSINLLNRASIWSLIIGVLLILTFLSINLFAMSDNPQTNPLPSDNPQPVEEKSGRTTPTPAPNLNPSKDPKK